MGFRVWKDRAKQGKALVSGLFKEAFSSIPKVPRLYVVRKAAFFGEWCVRPGQLVLMPSDCSYAIFSSWPMRDPQKEGIAILTDIMPIHLGRMVGYGFLEPMWGPPPKIFKAPNRDHVHVPEPSDILGDLQEQLIADLLSAKEPVWPVSYEDSDEAFSYENEEGEQVHIPEGLLDEALFLCPVKFPPSYEKAIPYTGSGLGLLEGDPEEVERLLKKYQENVKKAKED